jgi:Tfp pilus assembly PilM family ATPase
VRRTGIDLSSIRCNVVDAQSSGRRRKGEPAAFRVHRFASITHLDNTDALTHDLKALASAGTFSRRAWVNLWDVRSSHQYLLLPLAPDSELESRARRHGASVLGMNDLDVTVSTSIGGTRGEPGHHPKREVSFFAAGSEDVRARLRPIVDAGFLVEGVTTPCGALWSQARLRRAALPGQVHAHVALGVSQSALGIFGDGALLYARDLDWGYAAASAGTTAAQDREILAGRLSVELRRSFLYLKQYWEQDVSQVLLCGDMPEIRSLTAPLIERLNIEVETLDTLEGFDAATLPEGFAESASTLRLASSIAVEPPPVNLLPVEVTAHRTTQSGRRIVAAGIAAAVMLGAFLYERARVAQISAEREEGMTREASSLRPQGGAADVSRETSETKSVGPTAQGAPAPPKAIDVAAPPGQPHAALTEKPPATVVADRAVVSAPRPDPVVTGILVSDGRRVALVDGRIVQAGDRLQAGVVQSIELDAVVISGPDGQTRRLRLERRVFGSDTR